MKLTQIDLLNSTRALTSAVTPHLPIAAQWAPSSPLREGGFFEPLWIDVCVPKHNAGEGDRRRRWRGRAPERRP
jgi:hypothetical protein